MHPNAARLHFGATPDDQPKCQISAHRLRAMEAELRRYRDEDSDLHRQIRSMEADHQVALRRAEEQGYARGLRDAPLPQSIQEALNSGDGSYRP